MLSPACPLLLPNSSVKSLLSPREEWGKRRIQEYYSNLATSDILISRPSHTIEKYWRPLRTFVHIDHILKVTAFGKFICQYIFTYMSKSVNCSVMSLYDPRDCSPPGSSVRGIFQARILKWVAIPFSRGSSWSRDWTLVSCTTRRFFTIWATREAFTWVCVCVCVYIHTYLSFLGNSGVKNLPDNAGGIWVQSLVWEVPLEEEMVTHSGILAWKIPQTEEPGRLQSLGSQRTEHDWACTHTHIYIYQKLILLAFIY